MNRLAGPEHDAAGSPTEAAPSAPARRAPARARTGASVQASTAATGLAAVTRAPTWQVRPGALVTAAVDGVTREFAVLYLADVAEAIGRDLATGAVARLPVAGLRPIGGAPTPAADAVDLALVPEADWQEANARLALVRPFAGEARASKAAVAAAAAEAGVHRATLHRWIAAYRRSGRLTALLPHHPSGGRGKGRLPDAVETVVREVIEQEYLRAEAPAISHAVREVARRCHAAGLETPHANTVRARIAVISDVERTRRRQGAKAARDAYHLNRGSIPGADQPLALVQMDHTPVDLVLVDDHHRRPIGKPNLTVAVDVFSRMVLGFYVSFDPVGSLAVAACLAHAALPKEAWMAARGVAAEWPCWGLPVILHTDNAREFRGLTLERGCQEYGINLQFRRVATPRDGGTIESLVGTLMDEVHALPGTTFANAQARGDYDSDAKAVLTLSEFEAWLAELICNVYHRRLHSGIGTTPLARWGEGLLGDATRPGIGVPPLVADPERFRLDFLPYYIRTVQEYGLLLEGVRYNAEALRPHVHATDPADRRRKRTFVVRRDPRDASVCHFFDPEAGRYKEVPYADPRRPPASVWELREARRLAKLTGDAAVDEAAIFAALERNRKRVDESAHATQAARRALQRRPGSSPTPPGFTAAAGATPAPPPSASPAPAPPQDPAAAAPASDPDDLEPFEVDTAITYGAPNTAPNTTPHAAPDRRRRDEPL